jgi:hypothetical protein
LHALATRDEYSRYWSRAHHAYFYYTRSKPLYVRAHRKLLSSYNLW